MVRRGLDSDWYGIVFLIISILWTLYSHQTGGNAEPIEAIYILCMHYLINSQITPPEREIFAFVLCYLYYFI